jgi:hypothetical protein
MGFHIRCHFGIFVWGADLHAEGVHDGIDGFEAWVGACAEGLVRALAALQPRRGLPPKIEKRSLYYRWVGPLLEKREKWRTLSDGIPS